MVLTFKRMTEDLWFSLSYLNSHIDTASSYGMDTYSTELVPSEIHNTYVHGAIDHAHSKGMKFVIKFAPGKWATGGMEGFRNSPSAQNQFYTDFQWILDNHTKVDGLYLEEPFFDLPLYKCISGICTYVGTGSITGSYKEPTCGGTCTPGIDRGAENRTFLNTFFTNLKNKIFNSGHNNYSNWDGSTFIWMANHPSNDINNITKQGLDINYVNNNLTFNAFVPQDNGNTATGPTLSQYQGVLVAWKHWMPRLYIVPTLFLTWQGLFNNCEVLYPSHNDPSCWNPIFFDEARWTNSINQAVDVFILGRLTLPASMWPNDSTPGATAGDKLKYIWGTSSPCPTPICDYTITVI